MARGPMSQPLLDGQGQPSASATPQQDKLSEANAAARFEAGAQRVVIWTVWLLLAAVMAGTIIGVLLVSGPMQRGDTPPDVRKSAGVLVLSPYRPHLTAGEPANRTAANGTTVLVWSGKGHAKNLVFDDLHSLNSATGRWQTLWSVSPEEGAKLQHPAPRWKAVTLKDPVSGDMVMHGGDPLGSAANLGKAYLGDLWRLRRGERPQWQSLNATGGDGLAAPPARRAHAGIVVPFNGSSALVIQGGRLRGGRMLADVWAVPLQGSAAEWRCLWDCESSDGAALGNGDSGSSSSGSSSSSSSGGGSDRSSGGSSNGSSGSGREAELGKKKHKKHPGGGGGEAGEGPAPRKGHVAFPAPGPNGTRLVVWGGRNETAYFSDLWAFDLESLQWEQWGADSRQTPEGRDHLGGFYAAGKLWIYGGRGGKDYESSKPLGDVWAFDIGTQQWQRQPATGLQPAPRFLYGMDVYTASEEDTRLVVFGGETHRSAYLNCAWELSTASGRWRQLSKGNLDRKRLRGGGS